MNFTTHQSTIRAIKHNDSMFKLNDGLVVGQRAGFEISQRCPSSYVSLLTECINRGWIKPVAFMHDYEMTFAILKDE
jgi:hypothetical protein